MAQSKRKVAEVEIRYVDAKTDETLKTSYHERALFWAGARKGWYVKNMSGAKEFLTEQDPPLIVRKVRTVENTRPL